MKRSFLFVAVMALLLCPAFVSSGYGNRNFLIREYQRTGNVFRMGWMPYPDYQEREAWSAIMGESAVAVIAAGEKYLDYEWKTVPLTAYLAYERTGERNVMQNPYEANRRAINALMMAELAEGKGRFIDQIANGVWMSCHMPSWVLSAHLPRQSSHRSLPDMREQIIDLASAGYGATIAFAYRFFKEKFAELDPSVNYSIETAVRTQILDPFLDTSVRKANWWIADDWKPGLIVNNWNPWCNSNVLICFLLMEDDRARFDEAMELSLHSTDQFINYVKGDGACEEGPAYWDAAAGKLYDYLEILFQASDGKFSIMDNPQVRAMGEYIANSYIDDGWVVNFADASARLKLEPTLIYRYGKALGSRMMQDFAYYLCADRQRGKFTAPKPVLGNDTFRSIESIVSCREMAAGIDSLNSLASCNFKAFYSVLNGLVSGIPSCRWYPETEFAYFRNDKGWFLGAKGGFNNESHNHNDAGTFILYVDGCPVFVDAGVGTYTKQTFGPDRYSIWSMQSDWHSLPSINGTSQIYGEEFRATDVRCDMKRRTFTADISTAYTEAAACRSWVRSYRLKDDSMEITDTYRLDRRVLADTLNFMVWGDVYLPGDREYVSESGLEDAPGKVVQPGKIVIAANEAAVVLTYPASLTPSVTVKELADPRLTNIWGPALRRISFTSAPDAPTAGQYRFTVTRLAR